MQHFVDQISRTFDLSNRYVIAHLKDAGVEGVCTTLSSMSTLEMVEENSRAFENFRPFDEAERAAVEKAQEAMSESGIVLCAGCAYCEKVCPEGIGMSAPRATRASAACGRG